MAVIVLCDCLKLQATYTDIVLCTFTVVVQPSEGFKQRYMIKQTAIELQAPHTLPWFRQNTSYPHYPLTWLPVANFIVVTWHCKVRVSFLQYTVWNKKNACFSNNCNFVYFQYKKIMSTPKQPEINAVLITYINYSNTENYIGKMASPFLPHTVRSVSTKFCITFIWMRSVSLWSRQIKRPRSETSYSRPSESFTFAKKL